MQEEGKNRASEGFLRSGWSPLACKLRLSFCKPFPRGADAGAGSDRTAFRGGRQNVAGTGIRLSSCVPLGAYGSPISVLFPPRARLRGSRRGSFDVLTNVIGGLVAVRRPFGAFATGGDRRRSAPPEQAREFPRPIFLPFPESMKYTAVPHWISTAPLFSSVSLPNVDSFL